MPQLVGRNCSICSERIPDELDSVFCGGCGNPIHLACKKPAATARDCKMCGADLEMARKLQSIQEEERTAAIRSIPVPPLTLAHIGHAVEAYHTAKWVLGGVVIIVMGLMLLFVPEFRADPKSIAAGEVAAGLAAILVGIVMIWLRIWLNRGTKA